MVCMYIHNIHKYSPVTSISGLGFVVVIVVIGTGLGFGFAALFFFTNFETLAGKR